MRPLGSEEIRGTWGSVLLPINADETIDYERLGDKAVDALPIAVTVCLGRARRRQLYGLRLCLYDALRRLGIVGAGGYAKQMADLALHAGRSIQPRVSLVCVA